MQNPVEDTIDCYVSKLSESYNKCAENTSLDVKSPGPDFLDN